MDIKMKTIKYLIMKIMMIMEVIKHLMMETIKYLIVKIAMLMKMTKVLFLNLL